MRLFQDSKGFIWVITKGGVSQFDGLKFKNYTIDNGLPLNYINEILEDKKNNIWFITAKGPCKLKNDTIICYKHNYNLTIGGSTFFDKNDTIWMHSEKNSETKTVIKFKNGKFWKLDLPVDKYENINIYFDKLTNSKYACISTNTKHSFHQLYKIKKKKLDSVFTEKFNIKNCKSTENSFYTFYQVNDKVFINYLNPKRETHSIYRIVNNDTVFIHKFNFRINKTCEKNNIIYYIIKKDSEDVLGSFKNGKENIIINKLPTINNILIDNENNIWCASERGLLKLSNFKNYDKKSGMPNYVWSVIEDSNNRIWFAPFEDSYLYFLDKGEIKKFQKKFSKQLFYFGAMKTSSNHNIFPIGGYSAMIFNGTSFKKSNVKGTGLSLFEDTLNKKIYCGTTVGLKVFDPELKINTKLTNKYKSIKGFVLSMKQNKKGQIWYTNGWYIGTLNKTSNLEISNDTTMIYGSRVLFLDFKDNIWIGADNGLFFYNYKKILKIKHNELATMIGSVNRIDSTHLIFGGLRGIGILDLTEFYKIDLNNKTEINVETIVNYYDQSSGFLGEEVGQNSIYKDSKGRVWVPTNNNVVMFYPDDLKRNTNAPKTYITNFLVSKDNINWIKIPDSITNIDYTQSNVRFEFLGINLYAPKLVRYKFRLIGFNKEWSKPDKKRFVNYTNLEPGNYRFELLACNSSGIWNKKAVTYSFNVIPAWWQTYVAIICYVILFIAFIFFGVRFFWRHKQNKIVEAHKKKELHNKMNDLQFKSKCSQLYPHFLYNSVTAISSFLFQSKPEISYNYFAKLSKLIRNVLDDTKKGYKTLEEEIDFVNNYLELQKMRFEERFDYQIYIDENVNSNVKVPQMIIQTYVENSIKHGLEPLKKGGFLKISIEKQNGSIYFIIEDNGIGMEEASKKNTYGTKSGLKVMKEIYEIHNMNNSNKIFVKMVDLYKQNKQGTHVEIKIT